jgi:vacuolar-type H+-ATPase subunit I/STV1
MTIEMTPDETKQFEAMQADAPPQAPPQEPQAETGTQAQTPPQEAKPPERTYPEAAYRREQAQRREAEKKARELELMQAKLQARFEVLEKLARGEQEQKVPEFNQDPATHLKHGVDAASQKLAEIERRQKEEDARREQETAEREFLRSYHAEVSAYTKQATDFMEAYNFVHNHRDKVLELMGIADPAEREHIRQQEERFLVNAARRAGHSAPERLYEYAKSLGYKKADEAKRDPETGQFLSKKLETIAKGQEAGKSLAAGDPPKGKITLEDLANLSEEEFAALDQKTWRKLWGQ